MGDLIEFTQARRSADSRRVRELQTPAQILFFTGVRYERDVEKRIADKCTAEAPEPQAPKKAGVKRRRKRASA